jgi:hypothetical protein
MLKLYYVFATLSAAGPPSPAEHLREVFYRMGLNDKVLGDCCVITLTISTEPNVDLLFLSAL